MQVCTSLQTDNHASTPPLQFFTGRMPFLPPNQQCQSTEGTIQICWLLLPVLLWCVGRQGAGSADAQTALRSVQPHQAASRRRSQCSQGLCYSSGEQHVVVLTRPLCVTSYKCIAVRKVATPLRELTCHVGSHSVTCHPAEVTFPPLPQPKLVLDWATPQGCKAELT